MRHRSFATASSAAVLALSLLAGCGGDDEDPTTPTAGPSATTQAPGAPSSGDAGSGDDAPSGDSGDGGGDAPKGPTNSQGAKQTVIENIKGSDELKTFSTALTAAGELPDLLAQAGPYTVFAPNDDAFIQLGSQLDTLLQPSSKVQLGNVLRFHVVSGKLRTKDLKDGELLTTLQGTRLRVKVKGNQISVGNSRSDGDIVSSDLTGSNGTIHVIDAVLEPKD